MSSEVLGAGGQTEVGVSMKAQQRAFLKPECSLRCCGWGEGRGWSLHGDTIGGGTDAGMAIKALGGTSLRP